MAVRINPGFRKQLVSHVQIELAARKAREEEGATRHQVDICDWAERHFYIPTTGDPIVLPLHQKAVLRWAYTRRGKHFPFQTFVYSTIKKSGKSTASGLIARYIAETQTRYGEIYCIGNDMEQAKERGFKEVARSLEMTPGYNSYKDVLPGRWLKYKLSMRCLLTGSVIRAIAVDAKGEAGGQPALTIWTELWGFEDTEARRFWDEMTPINTVPDSLRLVETYAGYDGESDLLRGLYDRGQEGHQLTAGELAAQVCRNDVEGETYQDFVDCWFEARGDPNVLIPVWDNSTVGLGMYWDSGETARRMPWQHDFLEGREDKKCGRCLQPKYAHEIGTPPAQYYANEAATHPPQAFRRHHFNEWVGAESAFVPMESWDSCGEVHKIEPLVKGDRTMLVGGIDAAVTGDCFGIVIVSRCSQDHDCVDIRANKKWDPPAGGQIQLDQPEAFLREACKPENGNIVQLAYDPYQLESMAQRLRKERVAWMEPFSQVGERLKSDSQLYDLIIGRRIHYSHDAGCPKGVLCNCPIAPLREHIANANAKVQKDEDSKIRIVKKAAGRKIDLAVSLSMAAYRCLYLNL